MKNSFEYTCNEVSHLKWKKEDEIYFLCNLTSNHYPEIMLEIISNIYYQKKEHLVDSINIYFDVRTLNLYAATKSKMHNDKDLQVGTLKGFSIFKVTDDMWKSSESVTKFLQTQVVLLFVNAEYYMSKYNIRYFFLVDDPSSKSEIRRYVSIIEAILGKSTSPDYFIHIMREFELWGIVEKMFTILFFKWKWDKSAVKIFAEKHKCAYIVDHVKKDKVSKAYHRMVKSVYSSIAGD